MLNQLLWDSFCNVHFVRKHLKRGKTLFDTSEFTLVKSRINVTFVIMLVVNLGLFPGIWLLISRKNLLKKGIKIENFSLQLYCRCLTLFPLRLPTLATSVPFAKKSWKLPKILEGIYEFILEKNPISATNVIMPVPSLIIWNCTKKKIISYCKPIFFIADNKLLQPNQSRGWIFVPILWKVLKSVWWHD